jgi:hypothetical protein
MSVELLIMDDRSVGRYFQAAALSYVFDSLPVSLQSKILESFTKGSLTLDATEASTLVSTIAKSISSLCGVKRSSPTLYRAGKGDRAILSSLASSKPLDRAALTCDWLVNIQQDVALNANKSVDIPMLLRAYMFSELRDVGEAEKTNALSLYVAATGAFISIVASGLRRGEATYELYLVPDASVDSIRDASRLYTLLHLKTLNRTLEDTVRGVLRNESLSYELGALLAIAIHIYNAVVLTAKMPSLAGLYNSFERFRLISVVPEQRPMVAWERPLTLTHLYRELEERRATGVLSALHDCLRDATEYAKSVERVQEVAAQCVTSLFAHIETGSLDPLLLCASGAQRVADKFRELGISNAERDFVALVKEISRLAR